MVQLSRRPVQTMELSEIDYDLPERAIAQSAVEPRDASRLLVCGPGGSLVDSHVCDLPKFLGRGDLLVGNRTRVLNARVLATRKTGAICELLFLRPCDPGRASDWWEVLARPSKRIKPGEVLAVKTCHATAMQPRVAVEVGEVLGDGRRLARGLGVRTDQILSEYGQVPLPPYFTGRLASSDRYQTVFAGVAGSAAAPTAGLHFTDRLIGELARAGVGFESVSLDIGVDTFRPVTQANPLEHQMHEEAYSIDQSVVDKIRNAKASGCAVVAVGTTSTRAIEAAAVRDSDGRPAGGLVAGAARTSILIAPGHKFFVDGLLTNFHAPRSTLLMLLAAIYPQWREAYWHALDRGYRFLSFGDAMLVRPTSLATEGVESTI